MEDIIAVAVTADTEDEVYFLTWGRLHDVVDPQPVAELILRHAGRFALPGKPVGARVCLTLQEAREGPYFFECFFDLCRQDVPSGRRYPAWARKKRALMAEGKEIWYLGAPQWMPPRSQDLHARASD